MNVMHILIYQPNLLQSVLVIEIKKRITFTSLLRSRLKVLLNIHFKMNL